MRMKIEQKNQNGITLIALVITIIVLLILAGVTIATLTGDNGILTRANQAKEKTEEAGDIEKIRLAMTTVEMFNNRKSNIEKADLEIALLENGIKSIVVDNEDGTRNIIFLNTKKIYKLNTDGNIEDTNSDFDSIYVAPDSQDEERNEGVIGIGTDGKIIDMDLWNYCYDNQTKGYALNDARVISGEIDEIKGYLGEFTTDGKIYGNIPQYIKRLTDNEFIPVTNLYNTFRECINLVVSPIIPSTVTQMYTTFNSCENLEKSPELPKKLVNMYGLFYRLFKFIGTT